VTVRSPELAATDGLLTQPSSESDSLGLEELFYLLAQLECLESLFDSHKNFEESFRRALHVRLSQSLILPFRNFRSRLWLGFSSLRRETARQLDAGQRDVLWMEFVLKRVSLQDVFESPMHSFSASAIRDQHLGALVVNRGGLAEMTRLMKNLYVEQRRVVLREFAIRVLPAAVLVVSSLIAISMAALFLHSLLFGS